MAKYDYLHDYEVDIMFAGDTCRFWIPGDRPLRQIVAAICAAEDESGARPFRTPFDARRKYGLFQSTGDGPELLAQDSTLSSYQFLAGGTQLVLRPLDRSLSVRSLELAIDGRLKKVSKEKPTVIGYSHEGFPWPDIDLKDHVRDDSFQKLAAKHARIELDDADRYILVAHDDAQYETSVNGRRCTPGERVQLTEGMSLLFATLRADVLFEDV